MLDHNEEVLGFKLRHWVDAKYEASKKGWNDLMYVIDDLGDKPKLSCLPIKIDSTVEVYSRCHDVWTRCVQTC